MKLGKSEFNKFLKGKNITSKGAIKAKCYDCMGFYEDGIEDCKVENCPLYFFMPYKPLKKENKNNKESNESSKSNE